MVRGNLCRLIAIGDWVEIPSIEEIVIILEPTGLPTDSLG